MSLGFSEAETRYKTKDGKVIKLSEWKKSERERKERRVRIKEAVHRDELAKQGELFESTR